MLVCQNSLRPSSNEQESQYIPKVLPPKHDDEEESSSESFSSSIHGETVPDYDFLDYLNSCDPYPENLESLYSDLHFEYEDLQKYKILPLKYGKDIPAFILFSPSLISSSEGSNQPSTDKKSSTTESKSTSVPTTISDASIPLMTKITSFKVMEQRVRDYMDSDVGLSTWQMRSAVDIQDKDNFHQYDDEHYGEEQYGGEEDDDVEQCSVHSEELEILQDKQFANFGMLCLKDNFQYTLIKMALTVEPNLIVQDFNDEWHTPKHLTEDLTLFVKDLKDKYKKIIKKQKKTKEKKEKIPKVKAEKKNKGDKEKKEKKPKEKKGLTEEEKLEKQRIAELEAERIKRDIHDKFMFPLQDAIEDDDFFLEKFPNWKKVNWRKGK